MPTVPEIPHEATDALQRLTWQQGLIALGVLLAFFLVAKVIAHLVRRRLTAHKSWGGSVFALSKLLSYFLVFVGLVTALSLVGVPLSSLLLTSSALLIGVGFSLQHIARDFIAGIILLVEQPIRRNDFVTFGDTEGTVREIGLRATHLRTPDGTDLIVPNHLLVTTEVYNHSHPLERARINIEVPVALHEDVDLVEETLVGVAIDHPRVMKDPRPVVHLDALCDRGLQFHLIVWVHEPATTVRVASELRFAIAHAFADRDLHFPTPELRLRTVPDSPVPPH